MLRNHFKEIILTTLAPYVDDPKFVINTVEYLYQAPHRKYHTMSHINYCLGQLQLDNHWDVEDMFLALLFHDVTDTIEGSKNLFRTLVPTHPKIKQIEYLIDATDHSKEPIVWPQFDYATRQVEYQLQASAATVRDIDLAILGEEAHIYNKYEEKIWDEYSFVPRRTFYFKRMEILNRFLALPKIYGTDYFHKYEAQARINLTKAIKKLLREASELI